MQVRRSARRFEAEALLDLAADATTVWDTITDDAALARFMPGMRACRVIERAARADGSERLVVEQRGEFRFLLFAQSMKVRLHVEHRRLERAEAKAVDVELGLLKRRAIEVFEGCYELLPLAARHGATRTRLRYTRPLDRAGAAARAPADVALRHARAGRGRAGVRGRPPRRRARPA